MTKHAVYLIDARDNVATALADMPANANAHTVGAADTAEIPVLEPIPNGHKIALRPIKAGDDVIKYGTAVATATKDIAAGSWVHVHNAASRHDPRRDAIDAHTGQTTETPYE